MEQRHWRLKYWVTRGHKLVKVTPYHKRRGYFLLQSHKKWWSGLGTLRQFVNWPRFCFSSALQKEVVKGKKNNKNLKIPSVMWAKEWLQKVLILFLCVLSYFCALLRMGKVFVQRSSWLSHKELFEIVWKAPKQGLSLLMPIQRTKMWSVIP